MNYFTQISLIQKTLRTLEDSLRRTGRTQAVIDSVKNGDVLFVVTPEEMKQAGKILFTKQIKADVYAVGTSLQKVHDILDGRKFNNLHFDHRVIEGIIIGSIEKTFGDLTWFMKVNEERNTIYQYGKPTGRISYEKE